MNRRMLCILAGATAALSSTSALAQTQLTVYTAIEAVDLDRYKATFEKAHPDITINWVRDSTGVMTAKLLAEKDNPQADVVWGLAATSLLLLKSEGMLEPYQPKGVEALDKKFVDSDTPPSWVGMDAYVAALCYNTVEGQKLGLTAPTSWADLTKPEYKGHIVMPNPNSSGPASSTSPAGCRCSASRRPGTTWTSCMRTSQPIPIPAPSLARWPAPAKR